MSKERIKIALPMIASRDEAEAVMNELACAANNKRKLTARLDAAVLKLQEDAAVGISQCDESINLRADALRAWAESHPEEFAKGRKSIDFLSGTLGFRTGTPKLALLSRAFKWETVLGLLRQKGWLDFIRTTSEPNKDALLAASDRYNLKEVGLKVVQDESFYVEPKLTDNQ